MKDKLTISTIGDSLTEGSAKQATLSEELYFPFLYQTYTFNYIREFGISCEIKNWGVGGEIINEICRRFFQTVPADIIVTMGGTNDVWRYADIDEGIEEEICETILKLYEKVIFQSREKQKKQRGNFPTIFVCSIPPFGNVATLPKNGHKALLFINRKIKTWVQDQKDDQIRFCDVHKAMENKDQYMRKGLALPDGVHFTKEGNKVCGEAIGKCILEYLNK